MQTDAGLVGIQHTYWKHALDAITNGQHTQPCFARVSIKSLGNLLAYDHSFGSDAGLASAEGNAAIARLHDEIVGKNPGDPNEGVCWPNDSAKGTKYLRAILMQARLFEPAMRGEILVHMKNCSAEKKGAAKPASSSGESDSAFTSSSSNGGEESAKAKEKRGGEMYARAQKIFASKLPFDAHERPSYNTIAEMHAAYVEGLPFGIGLEEFKPQLKLQGSKKHTYEMFGKTWVDAADADLAVVKISDDATLFRQMTRRLQSRVAAGNFSAGNPNPPKILEESRIKYIDGREVVEKDFYATPEVQELEIKAMMDVRARHPHASTETLLKVIDIKVERAIATLQLKGYTLDAAVRQACVKDTENYMISEADIANASKSAPASKTDDEASKSGASKRERSIEDQLAASKRHAAQLEAQVKNIKNGKGRAGQRRWPPERERLQRRG